MQQYQDSSSVVLNGSRCIAATSNPKNNTLYTIHIFGTKIANQITQFKRTNELDIVSHQIKPESVSQISNKLATLYKTGKVDRWRYWHLVSNPSAKEQLSVTPGSAFNPDTGLRNQHSIT